MVALLVTGHNIPLEVNELLGKVLVLFLLFRVALKGFRVTDGLDTVLLVVGWYAGRERIQPEIGLLFLESRLPLSRIGVASDRQRHRRRPDVRHEGPRGRVGRRSPLIIIFVCVEGRLRHTLGRRFGVGRASVRVV